MKFSFGHEYHSQFNINDKWSVFISRFSHLDDHSRLLLCSWVKDKLRRKSGSCHVCSMVIQSISVQHSLFHTSLTHAASTAVVDDPLYLPSHSRPTMKTPKEQRMWRKQEIEVYCDHHEVANMIITECRTELSQEKTPASYTATFTIWGLHRLHKLSITCYLVRFRDAGRWICFRVSNISCFFFNFKLSIISVGSIASYLP